MPQWTAQAERYGQSSPRDEHYRVMGDQAKGLCWASESLQDD